MRPTCRDLVLGTFETDFGEVDFATPLEDRRGYKFDVARAAGAVRARARGRGAGGKVAKMDGNLFQAPR